MLTLPPPFEADLQSNDTFLIPLIIISPDSESPIYISTNKGLFMVDDVAVFWEDYGLKIDSIKESLNIVSRKFKINNLTFNLSNYLVNGQRFSDFVADKALLNKPVSVYYKTQSCKKIDDCMLIYKGKIRKFTHDHKNVKITLEDLTEDKLSKKVPISKTGFGENLYNKEHKNMPIPMVYGHVDRAATIPFTVPNSQEGESDIIIVPDDVNSDRNIIMEGFQPTELTQNYYPQEDINPLFIYKDDYFQVLEHYDESVLQQGIDEDNPANWTFQDELQYEHFGSYISVKKLYSNTTAKNPPANNELQTIIKRFPNGMKILTNPFESELESNEWIDGLGYGVNFLSPIIHAPELSYDNELTLGQVSELTYAANVNTDYSSTFADIPDNIDSLAELQDLVLVSDFIPHRTYMQNQAEAGDKSRIQYEVFSWLLRYSHVHNQNYANPNVVFIRLPSAATIKSEFKKKIWDAVVEKCQSGEQITLGGQQYNFNDRIEVIDSGHYDSAIPSQDIEGERLRANVSSHINPHLCSNWFSNSGLSQDVMADYLNDFGDGQTLSDNLENLFYEYNANNSFSSAVYESYWGGNESGVKVKYPNFWLQFEILDEIKDFLGYGFISASLKNSSISDYNIGAYSDASRLSPILYFDIFDINEYDDNGNIIGEFQDFLFNADDYPQFSPINRIGGSYAGNRSMKDVSFLALWNEVGLESAPDYDFTNILEKRRMYFGGASHGFENNYEEDSLASNRYSANKFNSGWFIWVKDGIYEDIFTRYSPTAASEENADPFPNLEIPANTLIASVHTGKYSSGHGSYNRGCYYKNIEPPNIVPTDPEFITLSSSDQTDGSSQRLGIVFPFKDQDVSDEIKCDTYFDGKIINRFDEETSDSSKKFQLGIGAIDVIDETEDFDWAVYDDAFDEDNVPLISETLTTCIGEEVIQYNSLIEANQEDDEGYFNSFDEGGGKLALVPEFHEVNNYNAMTMIYKLDRSGGGTDKIAKLTSEIYSVGLVQYVVFGAALDSDMYVNIKGRTNTIDDILTNEQNQEVFRYTGDSVLDIGTFDVEQQYYEQTSFIEKPCDILYHFIEKEVGLDEDVVKYSSVETARMNSMGMKCGFSLKEEIKAKDLINQVCKDTNLFALFKGTSDFSFTALRSEYGLDNVTSTIKSEEILKYSFSRTSIGSINTLINVKFKMDYATDEYIGSTGWVDGYDLLANGDSQSRIDAGLQGYSYDYLGLDREDKVLEVEAPYIRDRSSAEALRDFLFMWDCNQHNIFKLTLPLKYLYLEVGDIVNFNTLIRGLKAYGEDYTQGNTRNGQMIYPYFIVSSTNKKQKSVDVELFQLHNLTPRFNCERGSVTRSRGIYDGVQEPVKWTNEDWLGLSDYLSGANTYFTNNQKRVADVNEDGYLDLHDLIGIASLIAVEFGDFNQDGEVNVQDIVTLISQIISDDIPDEMFDVNEDGVVNVIDIITLMPYILGEL